MKRIEFSSPEAQRIYDNYLRRSAQMLAILSDEDKQDCLMEINSHIYESIQAQTQSQAQSQAQVNEITQLLNVLDRLGDPETTLHDVIAAKKIDQAVRTFNIKHLVQALFLNLRNGFLYVVLSAMTILLLPFSSLILFKIMYPDDTGYFRGNGQNNFGYIVGHKGQTEVLGYWFIPIMLGFCVVFYASIILLLKFLRRK